MDVSSASARSVRRPAARLPGILGARKKVNFCLMSFGGARSASGCRDRAAPGSGKYTGGSGSAREARTGEEAFRALARPCVMDGIC